jgi:hypothetical protein
MQACLITVSTSGLSGGGAFDGAGGGVPNGSSSDDGGVDACGSSSTAITVDRSNLLFADQAPSAATATASTMAVASGATIFVAIKWQSDGATSVSAVSGGGLSWTVDKEAGNHPGLALARAYAPTGLEAGTPITATFSALVEKRVLAGVSFLGLDGANAPESTSTSASDNGTTYTSGAVDAHASGELILTALEMYTADGAWSPVAPTLQAAESNAPSSSDDVAIDYRIAADGGSYTTAGAWRGTGNRWISVSASYRPKAASCP